MTTRRGGGVRRRLRAILRNDEVVTLALGAAVAIALVGFATSVAATVIWQRWEWTGVAATGLQLALVCAAVAVARLRIGPR